MNNHWEAAQRQRNYVEGLRAVAERERRAAVAAMRLDAALRYGLRLAGAIIGIGVVLWVLSTVHF
jgi:hypothetical protein